MSVAGQLPAASLDVVEGLLRHLDLDAQRAQAVVQGTGHFHRDGLALRPGADDVAPFQGLHGIQLAQGGLSPLFLGVRVPAPGQRYQQDDEHAHGDGLDSDGPNVLNLPDRRNGGFCLPPTGRAFFFQGLASACPDHPTNSQEQGDSRRPPTGSGEGANRTE